MLETSWLTFAEIDRLHGISDILDRLHEKGRFAHTLHFILQHFSSPFSFFEGFLDYLKKHDERALQNISQRDLFGLVWNYGKTLIEPQFYDDFRAHLTADFCTAEIRRPPQFI